MRIALKLVSIVSRGFSPCHEVRNNVTSVGSRTFGSKTSAVASVIPLQMLQKRGYSVPHYTKPESKVSGTAEVKDNVPEKKRLPVVFEHLIDSSQRVLLEEKIIRVDYNDNVIGPDSKKNCHLVQPDGDILLHRAFSVLLFNTKGELLLQQRSKVKVSFPSLYTNTCCSHPLFRDDEMIEKDALGVKIAAQRRLNQELGITKEDVPLDSFQYLTRFHYKLYDNSRWGEHEIDYVFIVQRDVTIRPNPNEIDDHLYVTLDQLNELKNRKGITISPWFRLIWESGKLELWWKNLNKLKEFEDHQTIHRV